ncbi:hypothetical protein LH20_21480 [Sphingopyxis sp. 113P3]|nr:hypothetical protein LH20_21480 [Sphingopyxis sp. 113P3]
MIRLRSDSPTGQRCRPPLARGDQIAFGAADPEFPLAIMLLARRAPTLGRKFAKPGFRFGTERMAPHIDIGMAAYALMNGETLRIAKKRPAEASSRRHQEKVSPE